MDPKERAREAQRLLNDPVLREALEDIRDDAVSSLEGIPVGTSQAMGQHAILHAVGLLRSKLESFTVVGDAGIRGRRK